MTVLYLGPTIPTVLEGENIVHYPVINILPRPVDDADIVKATEDWGNFTDLIFTSKTAVQLASKCFPPFLISHKVYAVGTATANCIRQIHRGDLFTANEETAEGVIKLLGGLLPAKACVIWPRASRARSIITDWLTNEKICHQAPVLYDTELGGTEPPPPLDHIDTIYFSSPSTVDGFLKMYGSIPKNKEIVTIGPITQKHLNKHVIF
jgi:uroporphyrinogen-III synthase